mgnify:CR=1 FL=1
MAGKFLGFKIVAENLMKGDIDSAIKEMNRLEHEMERLSDKAKKSKSVIVTAFKGISAGVKGILGGIKNIFRAAFSLPSIIATSGAVAALGGAIKKAFDFETYQQQFKTLLGSMGAAKERFAELKTLAAKTPFEMEELIEGSKLLEAFGFKGKQNIEILTKIGDAAASLSPEKLKQMAFWAGRLRIGAESGQTGEATNELLQMAVITGQAKKEIDSLAQAGASADAIMARFEVELGKFSGGMEELAKTGNGLFSTLKDNWTLALATFGESLKSVAKDSLSELIDLLEKLRSNGSITEWANRTASALSVLKSLFADLFDDQKRSQALHDIGAVFTAIGSDLVSALLKAAPFIGSVIGDVAGMTIANWARKKGENSVYRDQAKLEADEYLNSHPYDENGLIYNGKTSAGKARRKKLEKQFYDQIRADMAKQEGIDLVNAWGGENATGRVIEEIKTRRGVSADDIRKRREDEENQQALAESEALKKSFEGITWSSKTPPKEERSTPASRAAAMQSAANPAPKLKGYEEAFEKGPDPETKKQTELLARIADNTKPMGKDEFIRGMAEQDRAAGGLAMSAGAKRFRQKLTGSTTRSMGEAFADKTASFGEGRELLKQMILSNENLKRIHGKVIGITE